MAKKKQSFNINPWWNAVALIAVIVVNGLSSTGIIGGVTPGQVSDSFPIYFVPAGYVFSIWGLIYIALSAYVVYGIMAKHRNVKRIRNLDLLFLIAAAANIVWIFLWHSPNPGISIFAMLLLLGTLVLMYCLLGKSKPTSKAEWWAIDAPISLYLGWITIATFANISASLDALGIAQTPTVAFVFMVIVGFVVQLLLLLRRDYIVSGVAIWALIGIAVKFPEVALLQTGALSLAFLLFLTALAVRFGIVGKK